VPARAAVLGVSEDGFRFPQMWVSDSETQILCGNNNSKKDYSKGEGKMRYISDKNDPRMVK